MCGRYNITDSPLVHALLDDLGIDIGPLPVRYNIAPTENVPVVFSEKGEVQLTEMRWWLTPSWAKEVTNQYAMFNARFENLRKSPAFRGPYRHKRAVLPATSFIEWRRSGNEKSPVCIRKEGEALAFAGLWDCWEGAERTLWSCTIITKQAPAFFSKVHHRIPVILSSAECKLWLDHNNSLERVDDLIHNNNPLPLSITPVEKSVNNSKKKEAMVEVGPTEKIEP